MPQEELDRLFTYHPPEGTDAENFAKISAAAKAFAEVVVASTPRSADQSAAIRKIREARMTANAAIACRDRS